MLFFIFILEQIYGMRQYPKVCRLVGCLFGYMVITNKKLWYHMNYGISVKSCGWTAGTPPQNNLYISPQLIQHHKPNPCSETQPKNQKSRPKRVASIFIFCFDSIDFDESCLQLLLLHYLCLSLLLCLPAAALDAPPLYSAAYCIVTRVRRIQLILSTLLSLYLFFHFRFLRCVQCGRSFVCRIL